MLEFPICLPGVEQTVITRIDENDSASFAHERIGVTPIADNSMSNHESAQHKSRSANTESAVNQDGWRMF